MKNNQKVETELELLGQLMNHITKEEEAETMKEEANLVYNTKQKIWMEEGAKFRQATNTQYQSERKRIKKHLDKLSVSVKRNRVDYEGDLYRFDNRDMFVSLFRNFQRGDYEVAYRSDESITLQKVWYSYGMRSKHIHNLTFSKKKEYKGNEVIGEYFTIKDYGDRDAMRDYAQKMKYGWKMTPIEKVGL